MIKEMLDVAAEHKLLVLSDEIYDQITYSDNFVSTASMAKDVPVLGFNGFSKAYQMTGLRLGYLYFKGEKGELEELRQGIEKECRIRLCANTPVKKPAPLPLTDHKTTSKVSSKNYGNEETTHANG